MSMGRQRTPVQPCLIAVLFVSILLSSSAGLVGSHIPTGHTEQSLRTINVSDALSHGIACERVRVYSGPEHLIGCGNLPNSSARAEETSLETETGLPPSYVTSIEVGNGPTEMGYDPRNGFVYVPNTGSSNVTIVNGTSVAGWVSVGSEPQGAIYDSQNGYVYVPNLSGDNVSLINGTTLVGTISVGEDPSGGVFDPENDLLYVINSGSNTTSVIDGTVVVATLGVGVEPGIPALDMQNGEIYVPNFASGNLTVLNGTAEAGSIAVGDGPWAASYDARDDEIYTTNFYSDDVSVVNGTSAVASIPVGSGPWFLTYDPGNGDLYVSNAESSTVSIIGGTHELATVAVGSEPASGAYDSENGYVYVPNLVSDNLTAINGTTISGSSAVGSEPTYALFDARSGDLYVANFGSSNVTVFPADYTVTVGESGLPPGTEWWVNVTGQPSASTADGALLLAEPNGTYDFSAAAGERGYTAPGGSFTVSGSDQSVRVTFTGWFYPVLFTETGLVAGASWAVNLDSLIHTSRNNTIEFLEPNGTFAFIVFSEQGYTQSLTSGSILVYGSGAARTIAFSVVKLPFLGLAPSTWYIILGVAAAALGTAVAVGVWHRHRRRERPPSPPPNSNLGEQA